jgi:hypothetical protein
MDRQQRLLHGGVFISAHQSSQRVSLLFNGLNNGMNIQPFRLILCPATRAINTGLRHFNPGRGGSKKNSKF